MAFKKISLDVEPNNKKKISDLHKALTKLGHSIKKSELDEKKISNSTSQAIRNFQKERSLGASGKLTAETIEAINDSLHDDFFTSNKYRTEKVQKLLQKVKLKISDEEIAQRNFGGSSRKAVEQFQKKHGLSIDGNLTEDVLDKLYNAEIKERLKTKTQKNLLHSKLRKIGKIAGLETQISPDEIKNKVLGETSQNLIREFQRKYNLPETGTIDKVTLHKIDSVAASRGTYVKKLGKPIAQNLNVISKAVRVNKVSPAVNDAQKALSFLGYKIAEKEFNTQLFGKTTRKAVLQFQKDNGLAETGHLEKAEMKILNEKILQSNPDAAQSLQKYRIRGSVRDELWNRKNNMVIKIFEKQLSGKSLEPLATKKNFPNGFFDIVYNPPLDPNTKQVKENFHLIVELYQPISDNAADDKFVKSQTHYNVGQIRWVNFTEGDDDYKGTSGFEAVRQIIEKNIGSQNIINLHETPDEKQISQISVQTGLSTDDVMQIVLAFRVAQNVGLSQILSPEVFYAFIVQNVPPSLPGDLLRGTSEWETVEQLTELAASGIIFTSDELQKHFLENALLQNLVSRQVKFNFDPILQELKNKRENFALEKPILVGNQDLKTLLDNSSIKPAHYSTVASAFISNGGINTDFWTDLDGQKATLGASALADFTTTIELGNITKNHISTVQFFKNKIAADPAFKSASSFAKLSENEITDLINQNGKQVPANIPGKNVNEKVANFAAAVKSRATVLYPAESLIGEIKRSQTDQLAKLSDVENFIDDNPDFSLKNQNVDQYLLTNNINLSDDARTELKIVQRAHKQSSDPLTATVLIDKGLHSSMQIYFKGKGNLRTIFQARGVSEKQADYVYEFAKIQYLRILQRFFEYSPKTNLNNPQAISPQTFSIEEIKAALGDIPNLESLFGSMDFCECEHCKSLYSPAAYFTDMLRFISEHDSLVKKNVADYFSVKEILFQRRPDLGNIKLNCDNTNTPLPYIDLVCEILENYVAPLNTDFSYQTTLTAKELRAIPQYVRPKAYEVLAVSNFPVNSSFNLFQTEARTYLNHLRVPRFDLMETFQDISSAAAKIPDDVSIAAEYFGISAFEKNLIIKAQATLAGQNKFWGFNTSQTTVPVTDAQNPKNSFLDRAKLSYNELLELLLVRFVNNPNSPNKSEIVRPPDSCDTDQQTINHLTIAKFDLMHRFLRLWRKTGWKMWELDLLIRNPKIGNNKIDGAALVNLKRFRQLQEKLKLDFEVLLAFYGDINREVRIKPEKPDVKIDPLYKKLFQNIAITNPIDEHFIAVNANDNPVALNANIVFGVNSAAPFNGYTPVPTTLSALALTESDFNLLTGKTNNKLSVASLSVFLRYAYLARGLKISIKDLLLLLTITNTSDPFADPQATLNLLQNFDSIKSSRISLLELDYILNYSPDSSVGWREETFIQLLELLRTSLSSSKEKIKQLKLETADEILILGFNADALSAMSNANLLNALAPLQTALNKVVSNFTEAGFSVEETAFIVQFESASINAANKATLIQSIKDLQQNLNDLLNSAQNQIKSQVASAFSLTDGQSNIILNNLKLPPSAETLLKSLEDESFIEKNADGTFKKEVSRVNFKTFFDIYLLLHKVSLLVGRVKLTDADLEWFIVNQSKVETLDFAALPVGVFAPPNDFNRWLNLYKFLDFKSNYPEPENASIRSILDLAKDAAKTKPEIFDEIVKLTQWNKDDLTAIDAGFKLKQTGVNLDYAKADTYVRLKKCFDRMKLTGVNAKTMFNWALINTSLSHDETVATQTRQAVKSKYEQDMWLDKIKSLHDDIREAKRTALVEYHIENSLRTQSETVVFNGKTIPNPLYWKDAVALYKYFLIDVEMSSCQLTSRIKQAISSVQLFVQRCFLNLENRYVKVTGDEKEDAASANAWSQWKWMKVYRIWEANRKVFFYPENWLEPELRDDKSPFFEELENELMQNETTSETVEAAFLSYLQKVDDVSHLEVCGLYHELENLTGDETMYEINTVHVVGRTKALPHIHYYRTYDMNYNTWSAWEKIDEEIEGDQITPVVYNRRLHLFWLKFVEKPMKNPKVPAAKESNSDAPMDAPEPRNQMEIQLCWTIKTSAGFSPKKVSKQKLIQPWERPHHSYNLKPYYQSKYNELYLDIYISTSKEFNDRKFYDPLKTPSENPVYLTKNRFSENYLPWHSASFVFDGMVRNVKLKGLGGSYLKLIWDSSGIHLEHLWSDYDSYDYVHENFGAEGQLIEELDPVHEYGPRLRLPNGMHFENTHLTNNRVHNVNPNQLRVLEGAVTENLLNGAISPFELVITQQDLQLDTIAANHPVFYQDNKRAFFVKPEWETLLNNYGQVLSNTRKYRFLPFYHPYTMLFIRELNRDGIDGLLNRKIQNQPQSFPPPNNFAFSSYAPTAKVIVDDTAKNDIADFSYGGAYSIYNWELFFHAPLMIACRLMQNQKFEDAMKWFHYIFDPTNIENYPTPQRYWITKPFFEQNSDDYRKQRIENILSNINLPEYQGQLTAWKNNPFQPHLIARNRPVAYQKNVVMKYLDNLIAWGDMLFRRDTIESINEASLLYMLAYEILGDRPQKVPNVKHEELTFNELEPKLDDFGNARVDIVIEDTLLPVKVVPSTSGSEPIPKLETFYFCIPNNDFLDKYWDTVADRLYKIRHCLNIEGIFRQLPLFEPPIDPALLVKAAAGGIDLGSVLNDLAAPSPHYRFRVVVQKAIEFCNEVKMLGDKLLTVLEKKDVEQLSLLRSQHEIQLLEAVKEVRKKQIDETAESINALNETLNLADERKTYYENKDFMSDLEAMSAALSTGSIGISGMLAQNEVLASFFYLLPSFNIGLSGFGGSPQVTVQWGMENIARSMQSQNAALGHTGSMLSQSSSLVGTVANFKRRKEDWDFQARLAATEKKQIQFQIDAAEIRKAIAEKELENQELQIENAKLQDDFMRGKFTGDKLYSWMLTQISAVYFQAYQLAFEMAKKAEKCLQRELRLQSSNYIQFGYWDSLKKGLVSGDKLMNDLRRLEAAYIDQNKREFEITKHISLAQMFPLEFMTLKQTGKCTISLPEWIFDMDYPGHYLRKIKNISISVPCVIGPFAGVNCTLSLLKNETRITTSVSQTGDDYAKTDENDNRFETMYGAISSIATSHAQNDSGMFELNFNDERFLPFENAGAVSDWQIDMPIENNQFDFNSMPDFIIHINYTARSGGGLLANGAKLNLNTILPDSSARLFNLKQEFSTEWYKFINPENAGDQEFVITLKPENFPFFIRGKLNTVKIKNLRLFFETPSVEDFVAKIKVTNSNYSGDLSVSPNEDYNNVHYLEADLSTTPPNSLGEFRLKLKLDSVNDFQSLTEDVIENAFMIVSLGD